MTETTHDVLLRQIGATEEIIDYFNTYRSEIGGAKDGYDALAADLPGVVTTYLDWTVTFDPASPVVSGPGGNYHSLHQLCQDAPNSARLTIDVPVQAVVDITDADVRTKDQFLYLRTVGLPVSKSNRARIRFPTYETTANKIACHRFNLAARASMVFEAIDVEVLQKSDDALDWAVNGGAAIQPFYAGHAAITLRSVDIYGTDAASFISPYEGSQVRVGMNDVDVDGDVAVVGFADAGLSFISGATVTLKNGGALHRGGTVGTDVFTNI